MDQPPLPPPQPLPPQAQALPTSQTALWSMILGILSLLCFSILTGIPAIICGHKARKTLRENPGRETGEGMALAGLILGYLSLLFAVIYLVAVTVFGAFSKTLKDQLENSVQELEPIQMEFPEQPEVAPQDE